MIFWFSSEYDVFYPFFDVFYELFEVIFALEGLKQVFIKFLKCLIGFDFNFCDNIWWKVNYFLERAFKGISSGYLLIKFFFLLLVNLLCLILILFRGMLFLIFIWFSILFLSSIIMLFFFFKIFLLRSWRRWPTT